MHKHIKDLKITITIIFLVIVQQSKAQEVIASSGDYYSDTAVSISWTLGEIVTTAINDTAGILTQGFQQSKVTATLIKKADSLIFNAYVFPNPTNEKLYIINENDKGQKINIVLYGLNGKEIRRGSFNTKTGILEVFDLVPGVYILKLYDVNNNLQKTFKIVKN